MGMAESSNVEDECRRRADGELPEYERQRLSRIQENRARLEALGLPRLASSLIGSPSPSKRLERGQSARKRRSRGRGAGEEEDEDYCPSDGDRDGGGKDGEQSSSNGEEEVEEQAEKKRSRRKVHIPNMEGKNKTSQKVAKAKDKGKRVVDDLIDDDIALKQAIALSLGEQMEGASEAVSGFLQNSDDVASSGPCKKKDKTYTNEYCGRQKTKIMKKSRLQLTEDEVIAYFFSFDEAGKSYITLRDIERMVISHDFSWTEGEIFDMVRCFDSDGDGKLSLEEFRSIVCRCNMMQEAGKP